MHEYSKALLAHAFSRNDWVKGDLLKRFHFPDKPPVEENYSDFFRRWMEEAEQQGGAARSSMYQQIYAFAYVYAISQLGVTEPDDSWVDWIMDKLGVPYPSTAGNSHYDWLDSGLKQFFNYRVPRGGAGRLFVTGIGRQSGYFIEAYAKEYLRRQDCQAFQDKNWDALQREVRLPKSKIPRNGNELDYHLVWEVWEVLESFQHRNILDESHTEDLAEALEVIPGIAGKVIEVFNHDAAGPLIKWIVPELHMNPNNDLVIRFSSTGRFPRVAVKTDVVIRIQDTTFRYRPDGTNWRLYGRSEAAFGISETSSVKVILMFQDEGHLSLLIELVI